MAAAHYLVGASRTHHQVGQTFQRLLLERHRADYDDDIPQDVRRLAQLAVQETRQVFTLLRLGGQHHDGNLPPPCALLVGLVPCVQVHRFPP